MRRELITPTLKPDIMKAIANQAEEYFSLLDKPKQTSTKVLRLKMYKPVLENNNIVSRSDYKCLKSVVADTEQKAVPLKENFEKCSRLYDIYSEIAKTYYEISQGDYIPQLMGTEKQKDEHTLYCKQYLYSGIC